MALYGRVDYWNERYSVDKEPFEWYQQYSGIRHLLTNELLSHTPEEFPAKSEQRALVIGCGNSQLSQQMLEDGYTCHNVVSVDYASVVIGQMKEKYPHAADSYRIMDVVSREEGQGMATLEDDSFDLIILKGTFDSLLCGAGSIFDIHVTMMECSRVLGEHGAVVIVTHATSENRLAYMEDPAYGWTIDVHKVPKPPVPVPGATNNPPSFASSNKPAEPPKYHYVYILRKGSSPPEQEQEEELELMQDAKMPGMQDPPKAATADETTTSDSSSLERQQPPGDNKKLAQESEPAAPQQEKDSKPKSQGQGTSTDEPRPPGMSKGEPALTLAVDTSTSGPPDGGASSPDTKAGNGAGTP